MYELKSNNKPKVTLALMSFTNNRYIIHIKENKDEKKYFWDFIHYLMFFVCISHKVTVRGSSGLCYTVASNKGEKVKEPTSFFSLYISRFFYIFNLQMTQAAHWGQRWPCATW